MNIESGPSPPDTGAEFAPQLLQFVNEEVIPGTGVEPARFWNGLAGVLRRLAPRNAQLLAKRDELQRRLDAWHQRRPGSAGFGPAYEALLGEIGYLVPDGPDFLVTTARVDEEISSLAGPAAGRAGQQRALCTQCRQRSLGKPLRCALRHRRLIRGGRRTTRHGLQPGARRESNRLWARIPRSAFPAAERLARRGEVL